MSFAFVRESPDAKSVTSWPASTRPSARSATIHSMPPYPDGGTGNHAGLRMAILNRSSLNGAHLHGTVVEPDLPEPVERTHTRQSEGSGPGGELRRRICLERVLAAIRE